ncbi:MAG TPA: histone deacetylase [Verrucomicrobiota bacterium]|nr:histone deacetylase [Verrucomicrobiota bacterium]
MIVITDSRCTEYRQAGHPERPARIQRTAELLRDQKALTIEWNEPAPVTDTVLLRAHSAGHLARLQTAQDFDSDTPFFPGIADHARRGVGGALRALEQARAGRPAFSLLRPPGHHATRNHSMGFCYLSSMAVAALEARSSGYARVAVFDFDVHHGNGTEDILSGADGVTFVSVHQHPCYPGTGTADVGGNCFNFPVAPATPRTVWRATLEKALDKVKSAKPEVIGVSAGFDAYARDPLANGTLEREDYHWLGEKLRATGVPVFSVLEGGYSNDLPDLVLHYLLGLSGKSA